MLVTYTRRRFLATMTVGGAGVFLRPRQLRAAESPPETTSVRLLKTPGICLAPQYLSEVLLRAEGFTRVEYVEELDYNAALPRGQVDFTMNYATNFVRSIDAGAPITLLAGVHTGCYELFAGAGIRSIADLKGKSIGIQGAASPAQELVTLMAAQVGLDPVKDIHWISETPSAKPVELFVQGKIDAFLGFPPEPQELHARRIGNVIVNTAVDRPWSQYFCCMLGGHRDYVRTNPIATKRVLRAIFRAADLCSADPARAARGLVDDGFTAHYDYALQMFSEVPYDKWREYDAEDAIRFYALRLHDVGFIKSSPQKIIADGTDWRFLDEVKRELKA